MRTQFNSLELFHFCEHFSIILHSGLSGIEGLQLLTEDAENEHEKSILASITADYEATGNLSGSLQNSGFFPRSMIAYIKIGEDTGCLDEIMQSLASHYEQETLQKEQFRHAITYPLLMLGMMIAVISLLFWKVIPVFQHVFYQMGIAATGISLSLFHIGSLLRQCIGMLGAVFLIFLVILILLFFHPDKRSRLFHKICGLPFLQKYFLSLDYKRLTEGISIGLRSGLGPYTSLELAIPLLTQPLMKERLSQALFLLDEGNSFYSALTGSKLFQGMDARLISIGFQTGTADDVMKKLSDHYRENSAASIERLISYLEPTIVIILSCIVGIVLLSIILPLLGILSDMMLL